MLTYNILVIIYLYVYAYNISFIAEHTYECDNFGAKT